MSSYLRQSTAAQSRAIGPFLDATDLSTAETALTINNTDVLLVKNGGAPVSKNAGGGTHRVSGVYSLTFDATDTDTVGELEVVVEVLGARVVSKTFWVLEQAVYDAMFADAAPGFASAAVATEARLAELDAANMPNDIDSIVAAVAALNNLSVADVNAQVQDVLAVDTFALPGQAAPPLTPTIRQAIGWLYKVLRNRKTSTEDTWSLFDDLGTTVDAKATISDNAGVAEKEQIVAGP